MAGIPLTSLTACAQPGPGYPIMSWSSLYEGHSGNVSCAHYI